MKECSGQTRKKKHDEHVGNVNRGPRHATKLEQEFTAQMMKLVADGMDVAEIYSPPRIAARERRNGDCGAAGA